MTWITLPATGGIAGVIGASLTDGNIIVGDGTDTSVEVAPSGQVSMTNAGVFTLVGVTDGSSAGAGEIGQVITANVIAGTTTGVAASGSWGNVTSVALTAGTWEIRARMGVVTSGAVMTTAYECAITNEATPATVAAIDRNIYPFQSASNSILVPCPTIEVDLSGADNYYLNTRFYYTSGTPAHFGVITARRIR